jgi:kinesin family protein C2/C3
MIELFASDYTVSFLQEFGDQGEDSIILSPRLKDISTPDRPAALRFLGTHYCHTHALLKYLKHSYSYLWYLVFVCV